MADSLPRTRGDEPTSRATIDSRPGVCPAPAGMSPAMSGHIWFQIGLPRTRGDEPDSFFCCAVLSLVCPAPAGMSPGPRSERVRRVRLPRTRGDEPRPCVAAVTGHPSAPHPRG